MKNVPELLADLIAKEGKGDIKLPMIPLAEFTSLAAEAGFQDSEDMDTNGWQVDFWRYYRHPELGKFCLSGSLEYGDYSFAKAEEDTEDDFER